VLTRSVSELRKVFEDNPREPTYIQTIPKGGYRLVASVVGHETDRAGVPSVPPRRNWTIAGTAGFVLLAAVVYLHFFREGLHPVSNPRITSMAVLPLSNLSGDASQDYFAEGMTDELITRLSKISALRVISRTSVMHYKGTKKTTLEIARELSVDAVLEGSVLRSGDRVRISAQLIQAGNDKLKWAESYERDLRDVLALQSDVARTITEQIKIQVTPQEQSKLLAAVAVNPQAHDSYLKGLYYWNKFTEEGMRRAVAYFEQAIQQDSNYAPAYAGLAHAYHELAYYVPPKEVMPKAKAAAMRALQLDDTDAEAHAALGWIKWHYDWDWSGAEKEYLRALEVNPGSMQARAQYAVYLDTMGRFQEGLQEHKAVLELDPLSLIDRVTFGDAYSFVGRYDEAVEQYQKALEVDPNFADAHAGLGTVLLQQGKFKAAIAHLHRATRLDTDLGFTERLAIAYAISGNRNEARKVLNLLLESSRKSYLPSVGIALIYSAMDEHDKFCKWLERGYEARDSALAYINVDPDFAGFRSDPCFQDLMRRLGFPTPTSGRQKSGKQTRSGFWETGIVTALICTIAKPPPPSHSQSLPRSSRNPDTSPDPAPSSDTPPESLLAPPDRALKS
jgi:TolB-like protein/Tfp pilus assembly protein PilF